MKIPPFRHITRVDRPSKGTQAWQVSLQRHKVKVLNTFSDAVWGGKRAALAAARAWRDQQLQIHAGYEQEHRLWLSTILRRNNTSGLVGVGCYETAETGDRYWLATWTDAQGIRRSRKFSVSKWGERGARRQAIEHRDRELRRAVAARVGPVRP